MRVYGKYFSYRMLNIHKRKKCLSDAIKQPFQKESALYDARYIQQNQPHAQFWLVFDVDREGAAIDWSDRNAPAPNITVKN
ncbi:replication initiation protein, partial [Escherichia coli]